MREHKIKVYIVRCKINGQLMEYGGLWDNDMSLWREVGEGWVFYSYAEAVNARRNLGGFIKAVWLTVL